MNPALPAADVTLADEYSSSGRIGRSFRLTDTAVLQELAGDASLFRQAVGDLRRDGNYRVPYLCTPAIRRAAHDPHILAVVKQILGPHEPWVMWGPNLREGVPNEAHLWHVDLESWLWPTLTVVVGVAGCTPANATRCIPYSQHLPRSPTAARDTADAGVLRLARSLDDRCRSVETFPGFGDGSFYVFNAKCWHRGEIAAAEGRILLFLHYQSARDPRIPYMKDYNLATWFPEPAPYIEEIGPDGTPRAALETNRRLYSIPWRMRLRSAAGRLGRMWVEPPAASAADGPRRGPGR